MVEVLANADDVSLRVSVNTQWNWRCRVKDNVDRERKENRRANHGINVRVAHYKLHYEFSAAYTKSA
jgi:hypothetical protein